MRNAILRTCLLLPLLAAVMRADMAPVAHSETWGGGSPGSEGSGKGIPYLGVDACPIDSKRATQLKLKEPRGVEISMIDQDAPAGKAGLREHDVLQSVNGKAIKDMEDLRRAIRENAPGAKVALGIVRDGQPMTLQAQLVDKEAFKATHRLRKPTEPYVAVVPPIPPIELPPMPDFDMPQYPVPQLSWRSNGLVVENLTRQLGDFFGVKNGEGVLVRSVEKGSPADSAGFRAGDVIVKVNNEPIADVTEWRHAIRSQVAGKLAIGIVRDRKEQGLSLAVPPHKGRDRSEVAFDSPDFEASMEQVRMQMEQMRPQIEQAVRQAADVSRLIACKREQIEKAMAQAKVDVQKALREHQKEFENLQKELEESFDEN